GADPAVADTAPTQLPAPNPFPAGGKNEQEVPTRVLMLDPAARAALAQAAKGDAPVRVQAASGGSFGLDPAPAPPGQQPALPKLPAFSDGELEVTDRTTIGPPPIPSPPPLQKAPAAMPTSSPFP